MKDATSEKLIRRVLRHLGESTDVPGPAPARARRGFDHYRDNTATFALACNRGVRR
jgi:hypothetical protein